MFVLDFMCIRLCLYWTMSHCVVYIIHIVSFVLSMSFMLCMSYVGVKFQTLERVVKLDANSSGAQICILGAGCVGTEAKTP